MGIGVILALPLVAVAQGRPSADRDAMRDAMGVGESSDSYRSSRAYRLYLEAKLAELRGDLSVAHALLQQAVVYHEDAPEIRLGIARLHVKMGQPQRAAASLEQFLSESPLHPEAWMMLGLARRMEGEHEAARAAMLRAIREDPDFDDAYLMLLDLLMEMGRAREAEAIAEALGSRRPGEGKGWRVLAVLAGQRGDEDLSTKFLRRAVASDPGHLPSTLELAGREERRGDWEEAVRLYGVVLERNPADPAALLGSARAALRKGDEALARAYLRQLFGTHPDPVGVRIQTAIDLDLAKRSHSALEVLDEAEGLSPDPRIPFFRGLVLEGRRDFEGAAAAYRLVPATAGPLYPLSRARLASSLGKLGKAADAIRTLRLAREIAERFADEEVQLEVLRFVPEVYRRAGKSIDAVALLREEARKRGEDRGIAMILAQALQDGGRKGEAIRLLQSWAEREPYEGILFALAAAKERAGDPEGAVEVAGRILEVDPNHPSALNFVGYVLADHGLRLEEARALLVRAVELRPDEGAYLDSLGWCELQLGNLEVAEPYLVRAAELEPHEPEILHHLAELYLRTGRVELAIATWQRALDALALDPDGRLRNAIENRLVRIRRSE